MCAAVAPYVGNSYQVLGAGAAGLILHGGSAAVTVKGIFRGNGQLTTTADSPLVAGTTVVTTPVTVR
ncbi:hypothetical protein [Dactylosporangium cerinum]